MKTFNLDSFLRPQKFDDYIGQSEIKKNLNILILAAQKREEQAEHILLYGLAGLGKTTLANLIAEKIGSNIKITSGTAFEKAGDFASVLSNLKTGDILFIDEIHRLNKNIEEILYPAMENGTLDIILGKGPSARTVQIDIEPFTLIGATTKMSSISAPLRSRFSGGIYNLVDYSNEEIAQIIFNSAKLIKFNIDLSMSLIIAERSRKNPRQSNYLLKRCRDFIDINFDSKPTKENIIIALENLGIDKEGLTLTDRKILEKIITSFSGGPVGLNSLALSLPEDLETLENVFEPYLCQNGFLEKNLKGRKVTSKSYKHLGYNESK